MEIALRIHTVQFARPDKSCTATAPLTTMIRAEEQPVLSPQTHQPQRVLGDVIIHLNPAIFCIAGQCRPLVQRIRERLYQL